MSTCIYAVMTSNATYFFFKVLGNSIVYSDYRTRIINDTTDCRTYTVSIGFIELTEKSPHLSAHHRTLLSRISLLVYIIFSEEVVVININ